MIIIKRGCVPLKVFANVRCRRIQIGNFALNLRTAKAKFCRRVCKLSHAVVATSVADIVYHVFFVTVVIGTLDIHIVNRRESPAAVLANVYIALDQVLVAIFLFVADALAIRGIPLAVGAAVVTRITIHHINAGIVVKPIFFTVGQIRHAFYNASVTNATQRIEFIVAGHLSFKQTGTIHQYGIAITSQVTYGIADARTFQGVALGAYARVVRL